MALALTLTASLTFINAALALLLWLHLHQNHLAILRLEANVAALRNVIRKQVLDLSELNERKAVAELVVDSSTSSIETVHRTIANTTFGVLDKLSANERFRAGTGQIRQIHDGTSQGVYGTIRIANRELHSLADLLLNKQHPGKDKNNNQS